MALDTGGDGNDNGKDSSDGISNDSSDNGSQTAGGSAGGLDGGSPSGGADGDSGNGGGVDSGGSELSGNTEPSEGSETVGNGSGTDIGKNGTESAEAQETENGSVEDEQEEDNEEDSEQDGKENKGFTLTDEKVDSSSIKDIGQKAHNTAYSFGARQSVERGEELTEKSNQECKNINVGKMEREGVLGTHNPETHEITVSDEISQKDAMHTSVHEKVHETSYQSQSLEQTENGKYVKTVQSGIRINETTYDKDSSVLEREVKNRAFNEGITENYTFRAEKEAGLPESELNCYSNARSNAAKIESVVGKDTLAEAYYNGSSTLEQAVNELGKSPNTWSELNRNMDLATYSQDTVTRVEAQRNIDTIINTMNNTKLEMEAAKENEDNS